MTKPTQRRKLDALRLLESLKHGDRVRLTNDGRTYDMTVTRGPRRSDGGRGSWESAGVLVTLGVGRWSTRVDVAGMASGRYTLQKTADAKTVTVHRTYYAEDDVRDGDIPRDNVWTTVYDCHDWQPVGQTVAGFLRGEGLTEPSSTDWAPHVWYSHPDSSYMDHTTGFCCQPTAQLDGFTDDESREVFGRITTRS